LSTIDAHSHLYIDTHCHLGDDYDAVLKRAMAKGVSHVVNICIHPEDIDRGTKIVADYPNAPLAVGIHPCHAHEVEAGHFERICQLVEEKKVVAVGETGFDMYHSPDHLEIQKHYFKKHIELANAYDLPLSIHCRNAYRELMEFVDQHPIRKGVLHCFAGGFDVAEWAIDAGLYLSISGVITFKNAKELQTIVQNMPLARLLVETDAPYLAPDPYRGQTNEPAYIPLIAKKIAALKGLDEQEVAAVLTANSKKLFNLN